MNLERFDHVYIDRASQNSEVARRFVKIFPSAKVSWVDESPFQESQGSLSSREFNRSKRNIFITPFKGSFFKRCPGSKPGLACCNYFVLNLGLQCDMNCSYCYLQSFINSPVLTIYSNLDDALNEMRLLAQTSGESRIRIGTGETIDSLSLDDLTLYSRSLIEFFKEVPNWRLEFKTKSAKVEQFLDMEHAGNVIVSWSVNPQAVISHEELGTASLSERLEAAEKCVARGFTVAFHIDPMIWQELDRRFDPANIPYVSIGGLRFQPEQRHMMRERFGMQSWVTQSEMFTSKDGKLRYESDLRQEMFSAVLENFKALNPNWKVFLCMETPESWLSAFKAPPRRVDEIKGLFEPIRL
jgi:spore photoproduct lyase